MPLLPKGNMELQSTDPYEQKLYQLFKSHEAKDAAGIDHDGLRKLCANLELERGEQLVGKLMADGRKCVNFHEFRAALLQILGEEIVPEAASSLHQGK